MGKTWLAAFDARQMHAKRVLFVAHREEILLQAEETFLRLNPHAHTGLYNGNQKNGDADYLFASVSTLGQDAHLQRFAPDHFDYIVVDEFHHASAQTYQALLAYFTPTFLLGLTATPERTDRADILSLCDNNLVYSRDLQFGINAGILVPSCLISLAPISTGWFTLLPLKFPSKLGLSMFFDISAIEITGLGYK